MVDSMLDEDQRPFLSSTEDCSTNKFECHLNDVGVTSGRIYRLRNITQSFVGFIMLMTAISLALNMWMIYKWTHIDRAHKHDGAKDLYSPADEALQYEIVEVNTKAPNDIYNGPPTDESDLAWSRLLAPMAIRVYGDEMRKANRQSIRVHHDDQEIYIGALEVYHQLHCVKRMIQNRWPERYPQVAALGAFTDSHFNHCIQVLRKGIMCTADKTMVTWTYNASTGDQTLEKAPRKCVNWGQLHSWAQERTLGPFAEVDFYKMGEDGWYGP